MRYLRGHLGLFTAIALATIGGTAIVGAAGLCCVANAAPGAACPNHSNGAPAPKGADATPSRECPLHQGAGAPDAGMPATDCCLRMSACAEASISPAIVISAVLAPAVAVARPRSIVPLAVPAPPVPPQVVRRPAFPPPRPRRL